MHVILTGATGLVGSAVLDSLIKTKDITKISILSRRPVKFADDAKDPRIKTIIHTDFNKYDSSVLEQLRGASSCVWALGISQSKVSKEEYVKITKDYGLAAAKSLATLGTTTEPFRFIYVSGEGATQQPGYFSAIFARVKGETETALAELAAAPNSTLRADSVRPAAVDAQKHEAIRPYIPDPGLALKAMMAVLGPPIRTFYSSFHSPTEMLGDFFVRLAMGKVDDKIEGPGAFKLKGQWVIENVGVRRVMGV